VNVHEYQAKGLLRDFGVRVPNGRLATTPAEAEEAARALGSSVVVVKAQVHAGGRGKGGGIKLAKSASEAKQVASEILGMTLVTPQTGAEGPLPSWNSCPRKGPKLWGKQSLRHCQMRSITLT
jgi:succinyl-CoA synthetase beta subunit